MGFSAPESDARAAPALTAAVLAKHQEFLMYFGREALAAATPVSQEFIQVQLRFGVVMPNAGEEVRNSRKPLQ